MTTRFSTLLLIALAGFAPKIALALPPIANAPPPFRIYDVDRREREMRRLISDGAGAPALSRQAADAALGRLDEIKRQEDVLRDRHGGRLTLSTIRKVDAELNALSRRLDLREPRD
jgi:hypothetical protein